MPSMAIHESLAILKRVQEVDGEIYRIRQELLSIPEAIRSLTEALEAEKTHLTTLESQLKEIQLRQKKKEGELSEKEGLIQKYDAQLSQVKTNKEYTALQQEISSLKADGSLLEDQILAILDEMDQALKAVREERERLVCVEKESQKKQEELMNHTETLRTNLNSLNEKRQTIISQVLPETRDLYEKIIQKKEGLALVQVSGEACGACRIEIRPQLLNEIKLGETLIVCENCSRILYTE